MKLSETQVQAFDRDGFLIIDDLLSPAEIAFLKEEADRLQALDVPERILETSGHVRVFFSPHSRSELFRRLIRLPRLVERAKQLLGGDVYVHQAKIHPKVALHGDQWEWHQDFWYWHKEDGLPTPRALTAVIFLDEVSEFNGPLLMIPGTQKDIIELASNPRTLNERKSGRVQNRETNWLDTVVDAEKYQMDREALARAIKRGGLVAIKGGPGFAVFFHAGILHASGSNMSPWDRLSLFVTYNAVSNALTEVQQPRPPFLANRVFEPVTPLASDKLT